MNEDLYSVEPEFIATSVRPFFPKMIAISLALHIIFALFMINGGGRQGGIPSINFIDLTMSELAAEKSIKSTPASIESEPEKSAELPLDKPAEPLSETEELKQNVKKALDTPSADQSDALQKVAFGLGLMNGSFGTLADGKSLRDDMREYYLSVLRSINEKWWVSGTRFEGMSGAIVMITVARNGDVLNAQIAQSSGNPSYDRKMIKSIYSASPLPSLPSHFESPVFNAPIRFNAPLNLLGSG